MDIKGIYTEKKNEVVKVFSSDEFKNLYHFNGALGNIYSKSETMFRVWTPVATNVWVNIYKKVGKNKFELDKSLKLSDLDGIFEGIIEEDLNLKYYRYLIEIDGKKEEVVDPYVKAVSVNGMYGMIIDLETTNPKYWNKDRKPELISPTDAIIYEMHIRDFTIDKNSGVKNKGKFLGIVENETKFKGIKTGLDHLKELGITHVHLLPIFDFKTVNEENPSEKYNWGYDPQNYNALEGSYSINPYDGEVRIKEFKEMILRLHQNGIRVVIDMVFNHMFEVENSNFEKIVPKYYFRENLDGSFSNGSGCGNETASERSMVRKFIVDSILYYANEYHIDGFRFDLMGLHDIGTIKEIRDELNKIDKTILIYGEGWTGGDSPLYYEDRAIKENIYKFGELQVAAFNDTIRDGVKGSAFSAGEKGFASGSKEYCEKVKSGVVASTRNDGVYYGWWANEPYQTITYDSAHDNYTLFDKIKKSLTNGTEEELIRINKLIAAIILTSQGITFLHSGEEFLRRKISENGNIVENSYNSSDNINRIDWERKFIYLEVFNYYKKLIALRKNHKIFRMDKRLDIERNLKFRACGESFIHYEINGELLADGFKKAIIVYNGYGWNLDIEIEDGEWEVILDGNDISENGLYKVTKKVSVEKTTAKILVKRE
ncbi:type I pullulanase [uncultured Clostridium sp.]|uniref:type I pullulanase n=1 Tax=uncultured Clostridium sp. TaxID=59620 RepID=UPI00260C0054|nr:type I pullulanase [uncultured Clostridium sp.]